MNYTDSQLRNLRYLILKHIKSNGEDRKKVEKSFKKYGCNNSVEAYDLLKKHRNLGA